MATSIGVLAAVASIMAFAMAFGLWPLAFGLSVPVFANDHPANGESDLRTAITNATDGDMITFNDDVSVPADLPDSGARSTRRLH